MEHQEAELRAEVAQLEAKGEDVSSLLCDLASLKLSQGEDEEAQELFKRVAGLRAQELRRQAAELAASTAATSPHGMVKQECSSRNTAAAAPAAPLEPATSAPGPVPAAPLHQAAAPSSPTAAAAAAAAAGKDDALDDDDDDDWETSFDTGKIEQQIESHVSSTSARQRQASPQGPSSSGKTFKGRGETQFWRMPARPGYEHVVEVYSLSKSHTTTHLEDFLLDFQVGAVPPNIRWVDDHHALIICASQEAAQVLLDAPQHSFKLRPYSQASEGAQEIPTEELVAPRGIRPKTTSAIAKRLLSHALNRPELRDKEAERQLAAARRQNQQERRERQQAMAAAWDDP